MKLYILPAACSLSPHIVCRELALPVEIVEVDRKTKTTASGEDFLAVNGNGYVPALVLDDGEVMLEGPAIVQHLAELRPQAGLLPPAGTRERTRVQARLNFAATELHKPMGQLFNPALAPVHHPLRELVEKRLDWLSGQLMTETAGFTVADAYLFVCLNWTPWLGIDIQRWPVLPDFMARIGARPQVREALAAEGLEPHGAGGIFHAPAAALARAAEASARVRA